MSDLTLYFGYVVKGWGTATLPQKVAMVLHTTNMLNALTPLERLGANIEILRNVAG